MRAHPRQPTTGTWCDVHWKQLNQYRIITLSDLVQWVFYAFLMGNLIYWLISAWHLFIP